MGQGVVVVVVAAVPASEPHMLTVPSENQVRLPADELLQG